MINTAGFAYPRIDKYSYPGENDARALPINFGGRAAPFPFTKSPD